MIFDKRYFEKVFARDGAWGYPVSEYEKTKYSRQLEALQKYCLQPKSILEIGCAEGIHTAMIAEAFPEAKILCVDISHTAIERAEENCEGCQNIELVEADVIELLKEGKLPRKAFDIIIQSESLYYLFPRLLLRMDLVRYFREMASTLKDEGIFLTTNGITVATKYIMDLYYLILRRFYIPVFSAKYREWNEFRNKYMTYDLRIFRVLKKD